MTAGLPAGERPIIRLADLSFRYAQDDARDDGPAAAGDTPTVPTVPSALRRVSLTVRPGEVVMLCGRSGCGKTTVTRVLNGLVPGFFAGDLAGSATVCGVPIAGSPVSDSADSPTALQPDEAINALVPLVGSVFQNPKTQYFNADTTSELAFPCENSGMESAGIGRRVADVARRFGVEHLLGRSAFALSGGEKQRLAVAAATMLGPRVVVMDEPTGNLDQAAMRDLHDMVTALRADGTTVVIAEHRLAWCADLVDRYVLVDDGAIAGEYTAAEFAAMHADRLASWGLRPLDLTACRAALARLPRVGGDGPATGSAASPSAARPLVETRGLSVGYRRAFTRAIPDVALHPGEIVALMGRNGAGKSTLVRTLCGLIRPRSGQILLRGVPAKPAALTRAGFLVMQDVNYQLFADGVREELLLGEDESDAATLARADAILDALDLTEVADRHPMSLSGGQKQRLAIASALMCDKDLLVFDEPTSGLDLQHMMQVGALLRRLADDGKTVLVVTHDEELAAGWCDRILDLDGDADAGSDGESPASGASESAC
ncbi:ATP-binding cassette domain-containing protein [Bifidobacterium samirii]